MNIVIAGGTGLIGTALTEKLTRDGHHVYILTRKSNKSDKKYVTYVDWLTPESKPEEHLHNIDAVINLAGESIGAGRWTDKQKERILNSRIDSTKEVINLMSKLANKPSTFINGSATGYYGSSLTKTFTETSEPSGTNFLTKVTEKWEKEASSASFLGIRTVILRTGVVLSEKGGALERIILPYKFFVGGTVGSGRQSVSWVHIDDVVGLINFALTHEHINGPLNLTAPNPEMMSDFGKTIGRVMKRPHWLPAPSFALKLLLGEMSLLVLEGQKVLPEKAMDNGYTFKFPSLYGALEDILN
ncbi:TIGR01777 family oxidoreductase [Bacillus sp. FJAT-45350]|uniref:TIGR01777 family oxidoreductase n=1 Tax=Bacillus sp. FJAT-45350 TaxID=2011014 RepID=UPI000BB7426C|nr:TIGR01777 family oxidoreductase [Bacillus sp. FJAT-45350]